MPPSTLPDKWSLLPEFHQMRGLLREHVSSFDHFVHQELPRIVKAQAVQGSSYRMEYVDVSVGEPDVEEMETVRERKRGKRFAPHEARLRELTYAAPVMARVKVTYKLPQQQGPATAQQDAAGAAAAGAPTAAHPGTISHFKTVEIGRLPIMLRSSKCVLHNLDEADMAKYGECPLDPGGYFIIKGTEKAILIQEQLARNRVLIEKDLKGLPFASITSSTNERKSRTQVVLKGNPLQVMLKHNIFTTDIPIAVAFRAMGVESESQMAAYIGLKSEQDYDADNIISASIENEAARDIRTQLQALEFIGSKMRQTKVGDVTNIDSQQHRASLLKKQQQSLAAAAAAMEGGAADDAHAADNIPIPFQGRADEAADVLANLVFAHVRVPLLPPPSTAAASPDLCAALYDFTPKAAYLGYVVRQVLEAKSDAGYEDDRDMQGNKRLELAGQLLSLLFEDLFKRMNSEVQRQMEMSEGKASATRPEPTACIRKDTITNGLNHALSTGNWNLRRFKMERAGVTQQLSRLSFMSAIGHMTRIMSQFEKTRKVSGPRALQSSQFGVMCPSDTPEGESCGLVKNLALLTTVTQEGREEPVLAACYNLNVRRLSRLSPSDLSTIASSYSVLLNGILIGVVQEPFTFAREMRQLRRAGLLDEFVSVFADREKRRVLISTEGGRVCRPLIVVDPVTGQERLSSEHVKALRDPHARLTFKGLLASGVIEYVDVNEANNTNVATRAEDLARGGLGVYTHLEIDPCTVLGVVAGLIPFPHHNQSPRNTYQCAMGKQAIGTIGRNQWDRFDTLSYLMMNPQKPLVKTNVVDLIGFDELPSGQNAIVAVTSFTGYDIEDAVILNRASVDRGFGRCHVLRSTTCALKKNSHSTSELKETLQAPLPHEYVSHPVFPTGPLPSRGDGTSKGVIEPKMRAFKFNALDPNEGVVVPGSVVGPHHVLVMKETPVPPLNMTLAEASAVAQLTYVPSHVQLKAPHPVYVDRVLLTSSDTESRLYKIQTRDTRRPELGDKFSSRHGQKGVVGLIVPQADMPFNDEGICPDLVMNPHGFPSRMTVGKVIELLSGKAAVFDGKRRDGTAFKDYDMADPVKQVCETLAENGYAYSGKDFLYSGMVGEPLAVYVFMGPVFYQKLKHMVVDKVHARGRGPRTMLTRQPTEGRSKDGGLRLGEMERDCLIAYGTAGMLMERLMKSSDEHMASFCTKCGFLSSSPLKCSRCPDSSSRDLENIRIPYAFKLLFQELNGMNVTPRFRVRDYGEEAA